jgi:RNA polymerase sigma factor (sigma-70 family)
MPNRQDAEDICQESLARAIDHVDALQRGAAFRSWLFRIARNLSIDAFRTQRRTCPLPDDDVTPIPLRQDGPHYSVELSEEHDIVTRALGRLTRSHQHVLLLREVEGLSYSEIARRLNVSQSAVETLLFRARRRLRDEYSKSETRLGGAALLSILRSLGTRLAPLAGGPPMAAKVAVTAVVVGGAALSVPHVLPVVHRVPARGQPVIPAVATRRHGSPSHHVAAPGKAHRQAAQVRHNQVRHNTALRPPAQPKTVHAARTTAHVHSAVRRTVSVPTVVPHQHSSSAPSTALRGRRSRPATGRTPVKGREALRTSTGNAPRTRAVGVPQVGHAQEASGTPRSVPVIPPVSGSPTNPDQSPAAAQHAQQAPLAQHAFTAAAHSSSAHQPTTKTSANPSRGHRHQHGNPKGGQGQGSDNQGAAPNGSGQSPQQSSASSSGQAAQQPSSQGGQQQNTSQSQANGHAAASGQQQNGSQGQGNGHGVANGQQSGGEPERGAGNGPQSGGQLSPAQGAGASHAPDGSPSQTPPEQARQGNGSPVTVPAIPAVGQSPVPVLPPGHSKSP